MPVYHYECEPCRIIYKVQHSMNDRPKIDCPECKKTTERMVSSPNLSLGGWTSPTEARYSKMSDSEEIAREKTLQKDFQHVWLPEAVKHSPWDDDH